MEIHPSARKHGIVDEDIEHAVAHAMAIEDQDDDARLYLGPARNADLVEIVTIVRDDSFGAGDPRDEDALDLPEAVAGG